MGGGDGATGLELRGGATGLPLGTAGAEGGGSGLKRSGGDAGGGVPLPSCLKPPPVDVNLSVASPPLIGGVFFIFLCHPFQFGLPFYIYVRHRGQKVARFSLDFNWRPYGPSNSKSINTITYYNHYIIGIAATFTPLPADNCIEGEVEE